MEEEANPGLLLYYNKIRDIDTIIKLAHYGVILEPVFLLTKYLQKQELSISSL